MKERKIYREGGSIGCLGYGASGGSDVAQTRPQGLRKNERKKRGMEERRERLCHRAAYLSLQHPPSELCRIQTTMAGWGGREEQMKPNKVERAPNARETNRPPNTPAELPLQLVCPHG